MISLISLVMNISHTSITQMILQKQIDDWHGSCLLTCKSVYVCGHLLTSDGADRPLRFTPQIVNLSTFGIWQVLTSDPVHTPKATCLCITQKVRQDLWWWHKGGSTVTSHAGIVSFIQDGVGAKR